MGGAVGVAASHNTAGALKQPDVTVLRGHLPDGKPGTECRPLSRYCQKSTPNITRTCYRSLRHQCAAVDLGHATLFNKELSCLIYPPRSLPCYRVRTCLRQKTGASAMFYSRMAKIIAVGADIPGDIIVPDCAVINRSGRMLCPGFIDQHVHLIGGGGRQGPTTQAGSLLSRLTEAGDNNGRRLIGTDSSAVIPRRC